MRCRHYIFGQMFVRKWAISLNSTTNSELYREEINYTLFLCRIQINPLENPSTKGQDLLVSLFQAKRVCIFYSHDSLSHIFSYEKTPRKAKICWVLLLWKEVKVGLVRSAKHRLLSAQHTNQLSQEFRGLGGCGPVVLGGDLHQPPTTGHWTLLDLGTLRRLWAIHH